MKKICMLLIAFLITGCAVVNTVDDFYIKQYLNNKYGQDITFEYAHSDECNVLVYDKCTSFYTASDLGEDTEIYVEWTQSDGSDMRDDYLFKKYDKELNEYYTSLISKVINSNFKTSMQSNKSDLNWDKNLTFDEFLKYEKLNLGISVNIANGSSDITDIAEELKALFKSKNIKNIASLYITTYNKGCNLDDVDSCKKINSAYIEVKITDKFH